MHENEISYRIIGAAIEVHRTLGGPGLLESIYEDALEVELRMRGLRVERQVAVPVVYKGQQLASPLRIDMVVEGLVIVENKAVEQINPIFFTQTLTYLRLSGLRLRAIASNYV